MNQRLDSAQKTLADKQSEKERLEASYRKFLVDTYARTYHGLHGATLRNQHVQELAGYRRAWQTVQDEIRELNWLITDFETLEK